MLGRSRNNIQFIFNKGAKVIKLGKGYNCEVDTQTFEMVDLDCNMFLYLTCLIGILS